jgi:hypothetical protein
VQSAHGTWWAPCTKMGEEEREHRIAHARRRIGEKLRLCGSTSGSVGSDGCLNARIDDGSPHLGMC